MADENLLCALHEQWGNEATMAQQPLTIKSLTAQVQLWLKQPDLKMIHLPAALTAMRQTVGEAVQGTEHDLQTQVLEAELAALLHASLQDYHDLDYYLGELASGVAAGKRAQVREDLLQLRGAARSLADHEGAIQAWMGAPVLRCPRCGSQDARSHERTCSECGLAMLYPDVAEASSSRSATLGPEYQGVYAAYLKVVKGEQTLACLAHPLGALRRLLEAYADEAEGELTSDQVLSQALDHVAEASRSSLDGVHRMERTQQSRQTRDLHEGWTLIFEGALQLQAQIPTLSRVSGQKRPPATGYVGVEDAVYLQSHE